MPLKTWAEDDFHFSNPESRISSSSSASSLERRRQHSPHQDMKRRGRRGSSSSSSVSSSSSLSSPSPPSFCSTSSSLHRRSAGLRRRDRRHLSSSGRRSPSSAKSSYQRLPPQLCESIDVVVALGGDGTMLWVSRLFEESVPPVLGVSMGSLGYLTRFPLDEAREQLTEMAARKKFSVNLRCRLSKLIESNFEAAYRAAAFELILRWSSTQHTGREEVPLAGGKRKQVFTNTPKTLRADTLCRRRAHVDVACPLRISVACGRSKRTRVA